MKIKTQAILGTAFLAVSVLSLGALILFKQFKAESKVKMIVGVYNQRILLARDLQELILRLSRSERNYLLFDDPIYLNRILATGDKIDQTARKLSDVESPTGKEIIKQFIQERKDYRGMTNQMIGYMHLNRSDKSKEITRLDLRGATDKMDELLDNIIENNRESISQAESDALSQMVQTRYFTVGSLLFVVLFTAGVWIVVFKINRALTEFRSGFETLEERKFSTIPINPMKRDELSLIGHSFNRMSTAIKNYTENLKEKSVKDELTGLFNRRYFNERIDTEVRRSARSGQTLSLVILDIDHFKKVNDQFGHLQGDKVLQLVAKAILQSVRRSDIVVRYGGEEIALILPDTSKRRAHQVCEQLRTAIAESTRQSSISDGLPKVTVSCGIAGFPDDGKYQKQIVEKADLALYSAKNKGRDRVEIYESSLS